MQYVPRRKDWFYSKVLVPNLVNLQQEFIDLFWQVLGDKIPRTTGFYIVDQNKIVVPPSLLTLKDYYDLSNRWCSINFSVINNRSNYGGIHYDFVLPAEKYMALNIPLLNCENSFIVWYSGEPGEKIKVRSYNNNTNEIVFSENDNNPGLIIDNAHWVQGQTDELIRVECIEPMLVHTGQPHQPEVHHNHLRVLLSLRFNPELSDEEFDRLTQSSSLL